MEVPLGDTYYFKFTTRAFSTGAPTTLAGTPVISVYEENNLTQITAGITLTVDYDSVQGLNDVAVVATSGNGYEVGKYYDAVITAGTVGGTSVVGETVKHFRVMPAEDAGVGIKDVNIAAVSDDTTAADNLELQYDGTGLSGDTYPATQSQLSGLVIASAALSIPVVDAPNGFVLTTGIEINTEDATQALDGVRHQLSDSAGTLDGYYIFDLGPFGKPVSATFESVVNGGNDTFTIYANIGSSGTPNWSPRQTVTGTGSTSNVRIDVPLFESDTLTDDPTAVWLRVAGTGLTTANFNTDFLYLSRSILPQYSGYDNGAVWVDTNSGTPGTVLGYNGIASRPVDTFADALTIANALGLHRFEFSNDSSVTLPSATTNKILTGRGWELDLNGQDITNIHVIDAEVTGTGTGSAVQFHDSMMNNVTVPGGSFHDCSITGTFTCSAASVYHFHQTHSGDTVTPIIDLGAAIGATTILMHNWKGSVIMDNLGAVGADVIDLAGDGFLTLNASCVGGTIKKAGNWSLTNNGSGITINQDDNTANIAAILADTADIQPKIGTPAIDLSADIATIDSNVDAVLVDTGTTIPAQISGLNDPTAAAIAAAVAAYDMGNGRTIEEALAFLRNKWTISGGVLTVYDTDDTTVLWTSAITTTAGNPVSSSDPA